MEGARCVHEWGEHISPAEHYRVSGIPSRASQGVGQGTGVEQQLQNSLAQAVC